MASGSPITGAAQTSIGAQCDSAATGTEVESADVNNPFQAIENDVATIAKRIACGYTTSVAGAWIVDLAAGGQQSFLGLATVEKDKSGVHDIDVPHGSVMTEFRVYVAPNTHVSLPGTMPTFGLWKVKIDGTGSTNISTGTDSSGTVGAYNAIHELVFSLGPHVTVDRVNYVYYFLFTGESGANKDDMDILPPRVTLLA